MNSATISNTIIISSKAIIHISILRRRSKLHFSILFWHRILEQYLLSPPLRIKYMGRMQVEKMKWALKVALNLML